MYIARIQNPTTIEEKAHNIYAEMDQDIASSYSDMDSSGYYGFYARRVRKAEMYAEIEREIADYEEWKSELSMRDAENGVAYERQIDWWATQVGQE